MAERLKGPLKLDRLAAGRRHAFEVEVARLASGESLAFPLIVLKGTESGRRLAVVAGVHGDEAEGIRAVLDLARDLDPGTLRGSLLLVPVANPPAFAAHRRRSPLDDTDLNRVFPGDPKGTPSERLAARLYEVVTGSADFLFTLHSWYATGDAVPHIQIAAQSPVYEASYAAAVDSGFELIQLANWHPGLFPAATSRAGIPSMEAEIGGLGITHERYRGRYCEAVEAVARHLGIVKGKPARARPTRTVDRTHVVAPGGGVLLHDSQLGQSIEAGVRLGWVTGLGGAPAEELVAPCAGIVIARREALDCQPGDLLYTIAYDCVPTKNHEPANRKESSDD